MDRLAERCSNFRSFTDQIDQRLRYENAAISRLTGKIKTLEAEKIELTKAVGLLDRCIQIISANGIGKIESIVTGGLKLVFQSDHVGLVVAKKETARGNSYELLVRDGEGDEETIGDPMDSFGGGIQNVVGFLLRVILVKRFRLAKMLVLDEQFSNVSPEYQPKVSQMLRELTDMGFTIFAVSHQSMITAAADNVYALTVHCPGCGLDLTPRPPYTDSLPTACPGCKVKKKLVPRLLKADNKLETEELSGGLAQNSADQIA